MNQTIDTSFVHSMERSIEGLAAAGAADRQPSGRDLPSLVLGAHDLPAEHVRAARALVPLAALVNTALSAQVRWVISSYVSNPQATVQRRLDAPATLKVLIGRFGNTASRGPNACQRGHLLVISTSP